MTQKVFWQNPYLTELETTVNSVQGPDITVTETIFYALSGGQESDTGTIGGYPVLKATKKERQIVYTLPETHTLQVKDAVNIVIDGQRRLQLMRLHFAAELVLELIYQKFPHTVKVGAHISPQKARIDFVWDGNIKDLFPVLEQKTDAIVAGKHEIITAFSDETHERRYWQIQGFAQVPCGGTHVRNTSEIGRLRFKRLNLGHQKERVEIFLRDL